MNNLSKSKLVAYDQCAKRLWLEIHKAGEKQDSTQTRANYAIGNKVGNIAQKLYDENGDGVLIEPYVEGWASAFERTEKLVNGDKPIFEATFSGGGVLALADVMLPTEDGAWRMVEVKSSTKVKDYHRLDVAVQMYAAKAAGIKINTIALACIDSGWVYPGGEDYRGLLYETDLTSEAIDCQLQIGSMVKDAQSIADSAVEPTIEIGDHCSKPFDCGFYDYCTRGYSMPTYPASWLPNVRKKDLKEYISMNDIIEIDQVPDHLLNEQQLRVKQSTLSGETYFNAQSAREALSIGVWPAYFLDFETINLAIPIWAGSRPYEQVPYQFSNHIVAESGEVVHDEFLDLSGQDPRRGFAIKLIESCCEQGPIYVYNIGFERRIISQLVGQFEDLADSLNEIIDRLVDLMPIAKQSYYHPGQHGSWSIKKVLPAIAPDLNYSELDGVQDGGMAIEAFEEAIHLDTPPERKLEIQSQLLRYCELDTYAMVVIWRFFTGDAIAAAQ